MKDRGFDVVVAAGGSAARSRIEDAGLRFVQVPFDRGGQSPTRDLETLGRITALYRRERPDLVHQVTIKPVLDGSMAAHALNVPAVVNAISGLGFVFTASDRDPARRAILRTGVVQGYRAALGHPNSLTIFQNGDDRQRLVDARATTPARTVLIRGSGVDLALFVPTPLPDPALGQPIVLLPARLVWDKGAGEHVDAARAARKREGVAARFVLSGGTRATNSAAVWKSEIRAWEREGVIESRGHATDTPATLARATLVALPSFYWEGLPPAVVEAAAGRPAVTTDMPGCRYPLVPGETGWIVRRPRDVPALVRTLRCALSDRDELQRRGTAEVQLAVRDFDQRKIVADHLAVSDRLLGGAATPAPAS